MGIFNVIFRSPAFLSDGLKKKKIEFQYTKDSSEVNEPDNNSEENKDESTDNTLHKEIADDSDKSFENKVI